MYTVSQYTSGFEAIAALAVLVYVLMLLIRGWDYEGIDFSLKRSLLDQNVYRRSHSSLFTYETFLRKGQTQLTVTTIVKGGSNVKRIESPQINSVAVQLRLVTVRRTHTNGGGGNFFKLARMKCATFCLRKIQTKSFLKEFGFVSERRSGIVLTILYQFSERSRAGSEANIHKRTTGTFWPRYVINSLPLP